MEWKELQAALARESYIASNDLVVAMQLALSLERPLLLEGSAGVGKTELARALSCLLYTSPSPRDATLSRMPSSA